MYIVIHTGGKGAEKHTHYHYWYYSPTHTVGRGGDGEAYIRVAEGGERNIKGGTEKRTFQNRDRVTY